MFVIVKWITDENGQVLSEESPILSGILHDGSQIQLFIPQTSCHEAMSIRKFTIPNLGFEDYTKNGFFNHNLPEPLLRSGTVGVSQFSNASMSTSPGSDTQQLLQTLYQEKNWQAFVPAAILAQKNILISGPAASGKTTFLNSCLNLIPEQERLVTLEDTYELKTLHPNIVRLKTIKQTGINRRRLLQAMLRLRPDRIILGEIKGREVFDFISACSRGYRGALATIQANNPRVAFMRMAQFYQLHHTERVHEEDIYKTLYETIDIVLQLQKTDSGTQLVEVYYLENR